MELSDREFKTTMINMLRTLIMGKTDSVQEELGFRNGSWISNLSAIQETQETRG